MPQLVYTYSIAIKSPEDWNRVNQLFADIKAVVNNLDNSNLSGTAGITDANLASPNNAAYRRLQTVYGAMNGGAPSATYLFQGIGQLTVPSGGGFSPGPASLYSLVGADLAVAGKTTKLRIRAQVQANATASAVTFTFGLYPVTVAGGALQLTATTGAVVAGSTVAIATPSASTVTVGASTDVTAPSDGAYALCVATSGGALAANSYVGLVAGLDVRNT